MFRVLRSSAGAGKTHTLVKHYLAHCLRDARPAAYRQVLALTFTNKAAAEMKERVIGYLERLARRETEAPVMRDVLDHIKAESGATEEVIEVRAKAVLEHMLHHWSEAAISTIDAFTRRVVRPFTRDLKLDHELRTTTDEQWYRNRAVDDVLAQAGTNPALTELLSATAQQLLEDSKRWDPGEPLRQLGRELAKERSIQPLADLEHLDGPAVMTTRARMRQANAEYRDRVRRIGAEALDLIHRGNLTVKDLSHGKSGFHGFLSKLAGFEKEWLEPNTFVIKALEQDSWSSGSIAADAKDRLVRITPAVRHALEAATRLLNEGQRAYFLRAAVMRELPAAFTLCELSHCLEQRKKDDGVVFFNDLTRRVADLVRDEPAPFIHERLGERYQHYLLDEFQDTSLLQWSTLLPLVQNALASGGSVLLVGDAKQAIYRWRNGEARLFLELPRLFGASLSPLDPERETALVKQHRPIAPLIDNHRSAGDIIQFNNALFTRLSETLPAQLRPVYAGHEQQARNQAAGLVHLERLEKEHTGDAAIAHQTGFLLRCVKEALEDGFAPGDIAVLVRSNRVGKQASGALIAEGYRVTSPDGLLLGGDPVVEAAIALMRVLWRNDAAAASIVLQSIALIRACGSNERIDPFAGLSGHPDPLRSAHDWLEQQGITGVRSTLTGLITDLLRGLGVDPATDARALALIDEAHAFSMEHGPSLPGFIEHWDRRGSARSLSPPPDRDAIRVMTIHKAKGLEFPVVILPSTSMDSKAPPDRLWVKGIKAETGLDHALVLPSANLNRIGLPELREEQELQQLDCMDLLYVAFTRPVQRLYALAHAYRPDSITAELLSWIEEHGPDGSFIKGERTAPWKAAAPSSSSELKPVIVDDRPLTLNIRRSAPDEWNALDPDRARRLGEAAHQALSRVRSADDLRGAIQSVLATGLIEANESAALLAQLDPILRSPLHAPWFRHGLDVRNEAAMIAREGHEMRPDRVVIEGDQVRVLDYKTGAPTDSHAEQVRGYMRLLRSMGYERVDGALLYLSTGQLIHVAA